MKKIKIYFAAVLVCLFFGSCKKNLDPIPNGDISTEDLWNYPNMVQGLVDQGYNNMPRNYDDNEGAYLDCATDNAVATSSTNNMHRLATGTLTTNQDPFRTYWERDYQSIRPVNIFLKDRRGYNTRYLVDKHLDSVVHNLLQGEAFAMRAWFQWDLLQKFGGKGVNGQLLGFPIETEPIDVTKNNISVNRNTYDECVKQIITDCDSAYKYLPLANRDFLVTNPVDKAYLGARNWGRFDGITMIAIKSNVYLTWASPRFNPTNEIARWDSAAVNAKKVMDFKLNVDAGVSKGFNPVNAVNWFDPNFPGIVFSSRYNNANDNMERMFYPGGFQGNGVMGATQDLADAFPMSNGYPITDLRSGYDPANPYANRDPRFYSTIFYNTAKAVKTGTNTTMYTFENWVGGKDAANASPSNSLTNYHIKKFVFMGLNWSDNSVNRQPHSKFFIRWAHMILNFSEAANHVVGPIDVSRYGISAKAAIQYLRKRKTSDGVNGIQTDPYLDEVSINASKFEEFIRTERRIETCFEGMRFYDLRRWTTNLADLNKAVRKAYITQTTNGTFNYDLTQELEKRSFSSAYLPIPYDEILRTKLIQNEGWEAWQ
jgi:starch-binding outer membrane protein, SusD/RagB family